VGSSSDVEERENGATITVGSATSEATAESGARRRGRRTWAGVVGAVALSAALVLLVLHLAAPRLLGEGATGTVQLDTAQEVDRQLAQAAALVDQGSTHSIELALQLYGQVLKEDPRQPQALAESGYLQWEAGFEGAQGALAAKGRALVEKSIAVQPDDYAAHLFLGTIDLEQDADAKAAVTQFDLFLHQHPPAALVQSAATTIAQAYTRAGRPVPPAVAAAGAP
jgi:hypothetical protein